MVPFANTIRPALLACVLAAPTWCLDSVAIVAEPADIATLEANPYGSDKIPASLFADDTTLPASASYRGAYSLLTQLLEPDGPRNWKVKLPKGSAWREYREWNFNVEPHIRHKLARDLFAAASVPTQDSRHVKLSVNRKPGHIFLAFPDPDDKAWIRKHWPGAGGDLYKAATDLPDDTAWFGELTDLGDADSNYWRHYQKKLNNDGADSLDYSRLRRFIVWINRSTDEEFRQGLRERFDLDRFLRYLVVSNFIGHWDGYPNRGKNYWLYQDPADSVWSMIPWDVDASFQTGAACLNNMGTNAGLFFMSWPRNYCGNKKETKERPLFERIFAVEEWKNRYIGEYQKAMTTYLDQATLLARVDSLGALLQGVGQRKEDSLIKVSQSDIRTFIAKRTTTVKALLAAHPAYEGTSAAKTRATIRPLVRGDWTDVRGRRIPSDRMRSAPPGIYRRGAEIRVVL